MRHNPKQDWKITEQHVPAFIQLYLVALEC